MAIWNGYCDAHNDKQRGENMMKASSRQARQTIRTRTRTQHAASRIARRGNGTLTSHAIAAGLTPREARSVAGSLRKAAAKLDIHGQAGTSRTRGCVRTCTRYTRQQVAAIAMVYRPRKAAYRLAATRLTLAA